MSLEPAISLSLTTLAAFTLLAWLWLVIDAARGRRHVLLLDGPFTSVARRPAVSVVIAARNEARHIETALASVLSLDYENLEVIVVDDRSEDATAAILETLAARQPRLRVQHLEEVPRGWLGKNHALHHGAARATGDLVLFTDADVVFTSSLLTRAVEAFEHHRLDHLTAAGDVIAPGPGVELFVATFALIFNGYFRPWRMGQPGRSEVVGVGAFNLVRRDLYLAAGGHGPIAMRPDDDLQLARLLQRCGARQRFAAAGSLLRVEWYPTLAAAVRGLEKNSLAAVDYSFGLLLAGGIAQMATVAWPFLALLVTSGPTWGLNLAIVALIAGLHGSLLRYTSLRLWTVAALPLGICLIVFTTLRAALLTWWRGGIEWRGTFYPWAALRAGARPVVAEPAATDRDREGR